MCMGIPVKVVEMRGSYALCESDGEQQLIDMLLVGEQPAGTWVLNFLGAAREVMSADQAQATRQALQAMSLVMQQGVESSTAFDALFADLIDREPPLPEHLRSQVLNQG